MRHSRRNAGKGHEFGGSGEDSFVAVVVTKLTGALLFILLLTMVIMALLPKAVDLPASGRPDSADQDDARSELTITTPEALPEAIAGRRYTLALAATGGKGPIHWSVSGTIPDGLTLDAEHGVLTGTPAKGTPEPVELILRASDGGRQATRATSLVVYQSDKPLTTPAWWKPGIPPVPWREWLDLGFGFLVLWLVHVVGMQTVSGIERWSCARRGLRGAEEEAGALKTVCRRFKAYRMSIRLASLSATLALGFWLWRHHA